MDTLSSIFSALSDPVRRSILNDLMGGPRSAGALGEPYAISAPAISRHLKVMEKAGLISRKRDAQTIYCSIRADRLKEATDWLEEYSRFWNASFDRLDKLLTPENHAPRETE